MLSAARHPHSRSITAANVACLLLAGALVALMLTAFVVRVPFPYELEWMEGATVIHVDRLAKGQPIYVRPSLDFVPFAYPPLYYVACAPLTWGLGGGFAAARLVSALASLATLAAIFLIVRRHAGVVQGTVACGVFAGTYALSDGWFDLARVDAMYIALMALAWLRITRATTPGHWVVAGVLVSLAFLTKQPALLSVAPLGLFLSLSDRRAAAWFGGTIGLLAVASFAVLDAWSDGWYRYYVMELPRLRLRVSLDTTRLVGFWTQDLLRPLPVALVLGAAGTFAVRRYRDGWLAIGLVATAWMARLEGGAWNNAALPAYLAVAIVFGLSLQRLGRWTLPVSIAAAAQLALLLYDPRPFMPTAADRAAGARTVQAMRGLQPPVLVLDHNYWSTLAGGREYAHGWAVTDVVWADRTKAGPALESEIRTAIRERHFGAIVVDSGTSWFLGDVESSYTERAPVAEGEAYRPRSGARRSPEVVFLKAR